MTDKVRPQDAAAVAEDWWRRLNSEDTGRRGVRRAALARLRRAATPLEAMQEPEALRLIVRLPRDPDRVATLAGVLACVRETDDRPVARTIGRESLDDEKAVMAEVRFRRLLQARPAELMDAMRRLVALTKWRVNVYDLSYAVLHWGDRVKKQWIFDYYGVSENVSGGDALPVPPSPGRDLNEGA